MSDILASPTHALPPSQLGAERRKECVSTPRTQLRFGLPETVSHQTRLSAPITNPFASPAEGVREGGASPPKPPRRNDRRMDFSREEKTHTQTYLPQAESALADSAHPASRNNAMWEERAATL